MLRFFFFVIFCCLFAAGSLQAQVPGYQGKKFYMNLNAASFPQIQGAFTGHDVRLASKFRYGARLGYVVARHGSIEFGYERFLKNTRTFNRDVKTHIKNNVLGIGYKYFSQKSVAPVGKYFQTDLLCAFGSFEDIDDEHNYWVDSETLPDGFSSNYFTPIVNLSFGGQTVLFDGMLVGFGLQLGLPLTKVGWIGRFTSEYDVYDAKDYAYEIVSRQYFVNLRLEIGFLAF